MRYYVTKVLHRINEKGYLQEYYLYDRLLTVVAVRRHILKGSPMRKMQDYIVQSKEVFVGLEDSKKTWKVAVRSEDLVIHEASMPADYKALIGYLRNNYPKCRIKVLYEAGFHGFWLHDLLTKDGIECVVVPPHTVTEEKTKRVKTDKIDSRRLAHNLEKNDYKSCYVPDKERREDRQFSRPEPGRSFVRS